MSSTNRVKVAGAHGRSLAPESTAPIASAACWRGGSITCPYMSAVIRMEAWPSTLRDDLQRHARGEHDRRRRVAQLVDVPAPETGLLGAAVAAPVDGAFAVPAPAPAGRRFRHVSASRSLGYILGYTTSQEATGDEETGSRLSV